ncbi:tetratricopeptide repeat protein [Campylobacter ureolyticus]|uniref:beta-lactamase n=1 Tax=Campylobacter ureolyticus TaxID=827 RepID=A0A381E723_9BACT|nr:tetratricopeptide repeat protein [Campylobacter ureolyticus]MCR8685194.1 sel1 repeat family protein [Campylobacter ureolyticus]MCZ6162523.1 tetratricopeptide repeat protein [Campylobacter ureolyticus]MCZ6171524.1 tetratricopeptide repeat protein [Campylobacter ureolyticus]QKF84535.1 Sel1 domain-containing protein [Campylobacter ureolyticus]QQY35306.1 sel1 repeat family protein [Campylobacter ureolyticus]
MKFFLVFIIVFNYCFSNENLYDCGLKHLNEAEIKYKKAYDLADDICKSGDLMGCLLVATMTGNGKGVIKDKEKSFEMLADLCLNHNYACSNYYSVLYQDKKDEKIVSNLKILCDKNDSMACHTLGKIYSDMDYFKKACDLNFDESCGEITDIKYLIKKCNLSNHWTCEKVGDFFLEKNNTSKSELYYEKAFLFFKKECESDLFACKELSNFYKDGKGVEKDIKKSKFYLEKYINNILNIKEK